MILNISQRLGFEKSLTVRKFGCTKRELNRAELMLTTLFVVTLLNTNDSVEAIKNIWNMCRYDMAWEVDKLSPWCAIFSKEELMVLEYAEDLEDYYKRGYGHEINSRLGCPPLRDLFQHFELVDDL